MLVNRFVLLPLIAMLALVSCNRDPEVAKRRSFESGNRYFAKGKYREASIMYKDALQKDQLWGPAHYHLALTLLKLNQASGAVPEFRKAIERLPKNDADRRDAMIKLSEVYLQVARDKRYMDEVEGYTKDLLAQDPNSFDGHRLTGDMIFVNALRDFASANREQGKKGLDDALAEYRKAEAIKPGQQGIMMQMARVETGKQEYPEAERLYHKVIDSEKAALEAYRELYRLYMYQQKRDEGERVLKLGYQNNPKEYTFLTALALHYSMTQRRDDMVNILQQIKAHAKDFPKAYLTVGDFYFRLGDAESAKREYQEGISKDPTQKALYQKRIIQLLMEEGKRNEAAELNQQILKTDPNDTDAKDLEATLLLDKGQITQALTELQAVVNRAPENPVAHFQLGRAHAARHEYEQARQQFEKTLELQPNNLQARLALGELELMRGEFDAALKTAQQTLMIDRANTNARLIASSALIGERKLPEARKLLEEMAKALPKSSPVQFQLGVVNLAEKKFKDAEDNFRKSYDLHPAGSRGLLGIVESDMMQNKPDAAIALLQAESAKAPNRLDTKVALGNTAVRAGRYDIALEAYNSVLGALDKNAKQRGEIYLRMGDAYKRKGDPNAAVEALKQARQILPENVVVLSTLALVLDQNGHWDEARKVYDASLKLKSDDPVALNNDAYLMAEHGGDLDQALGMAVKAKQLLPNLGEIYDTIGWIYLKKQMSQQAIEVFRDLVRKNPEASTYHYHLAMAFYQKGDSPHAAEELQAALKGHPVSDERQKIQELLTRVSNSSH